MKRMAILLYGVVAYVSFLAVFMYLLGFMIGVGVPKGIDDGAAGPWGMALAINVGLVLLFGVQHSVMARPKFKRWVTQYIPEPMERSTFVMMTNVVLAVMFFAWRPMTATVWSVTNPIGMWAIIGMFVVGTSIALYSTFLINHFDLFGLRQVVLHMRGSQYSPVPMKIVSLYQLVRNPLMLGFLIAIWATPTMTVGHLVFSIAMSTYIAIGVYFEERTLAKELGPIYTSYRARTPMLLPIPRRDKNYAMSQMDRDTIAKGSEA